jgi:hypothetical protein
MPSLDENFLKQLHSDYKKYPLFVETGTYKGITINKMEKYFRELHTIEIKEELYTNEKTRYKGNKINFHLGDSSTILEKLVPTLNENTVFFLDGHWSAGITGRGQKDCPLIEEVTIINKYFKKEAIIIIDDYRQFNKKFMTTRMGVCDWSYITKNNILNILKERIISVYHLPSEMHPQDRLIIKIKNI